MVSSSIPTQIRTFLGCGGSCSACLFRLGTNIEEYNHFVVRQEKFQAPLFLDLRGSKTLASLVHTLNPKPSMLFVRAFNKVPPHSEIPTYGGLGGDLGLGSKVKGVYWGHI